MGIPLYANQIVSRIYKTGICLLPSTPYLIKIDITITDCFFHSYKSNDKTDNKMADICRKTNAIWGDFYKSSCAVSMNEWLNE